MASRATLFFMEKGFGKEIPYRRSFLSSPLIPFLKSSRRLRDWDFSTSCVGVVLF
jgi:hypothetical protein